MASHLWNNNAIGSVSLENISTNFQNDKSILKVTNIQYYILNVYSLFEPWQEQFIKIRTV